jgi:hypothetical protein
VRNVLADEGADRRDVSIASVLDRLN